MEDKTRSLRSILNIMVGQNPDYDSSEDWDINDAIKQIQELMPSHQSILNEMLKYHKVAYKDLKEWQRMTMVDEAKAIHSLIMSKVREDI